MLILNTNDRATTISIPTKAMQYLFTADELLSKKAKLNGTELKLTANDQVPLLQGKLVKKGQVDLPAHSIVFLEFNK